jgi:phosphoglucomutase
MSVVSHPATGFAVGDPDARPLVRGRLPSASDMAKAASPLILSASGWRKVFAADGDEESRAETLTSADAVLAGAAALAFGEALRARTGKADAAVLVGVDSRPTGPAIADAMIRVFLGMGLRPRYLFIVAAPEIMAYAARAVRLPADHEERAEGFCYVSASHNPVGHNGLKFGFDGGVLTAAESAPLAATFKSLLADPLTPERVDRLMEAADRRAVGRIFSEVSAWKRRSYSAYALFAREVVTGLSDLDAQEELLSRIADCAAENPVGVVAELNGSARCLSIDRDFLDGLGVVVRSVNDRPREFAHRIVPEGASLGAALAELEAARAEDPAFELGYVPDCDGDRGNLVRYDSKEARAVPLEAQEVFALACVSELASLEAAGTAGKRAIVVNDATSMRIEAIARAFGAEVFRAETGEANVVCLADALRERGYIVRILGEGSNGGNITHPSRVRDPLATLAAALKILLLRGAESDGALRRGPESEGGTVGTAGGAEGLYHIWLRRTGRLDAYDPGFDLSDVVGSLPSFATTSVFEKRAALAIKSADHAALKARYATIFARDWEARRAELSSRLGIVSWEAYATKGTTEFRTDADFAGSGSGGLRILFRDASGDGRASVWMRGSGTEPAFRVMADVAGGLVADEEYLLAWQTDMLMRADDQP